MGIAMEHQFGNRMERGRLEEKARESFFFADKLPTDREKRLWQNHCVHIT